MRLLCTVLMLFVASASMAQKKSNPRKFAETITVADLKTHLNIIAGAGMEGRETATEGQRKAASYIENHFKTLGLLPANKESYQMYYPVYRDSLVGSQMMINEKSFNLNEDFQPILQLNRNGSQYFSEIVFVGHGIVDSAFDDYGNVDVTGKAVLIIDGVPSTYKTNKPGWNEPGGLYGKYRNAAEKGAAAVIIVGSGFPRKPTPPIGNMYKELYTAIQAPSIFTVSSKLAEAIVGSEWQAFLQRGKTSQIPARVIKATALMELDKKVQMLQSSNVLGYIEGSDKKDEWLIITAHYDHLGKRGEKIYYGADDDGSGTVSVLEIAEAFAKAKAAGNGPRRNVMIMAVSGEEKGLWGSEFFSDNPSVPLDMVTADLNIDMVGRVDTERKTADTLNYIYVVGNDKLSTELSPLSEAANNKYVKLKLDYKFNDPNDTEQIYFRSDHYNFAKKGVPVIFYYDGMLKADYHQPTDTPDKINYELMTKRARLVFHTAWEMANRNEMIKRDLALPTMTR